VRSSDDVPGVKAVETASCGIHVKLYYLIMQTRRTVSASMDRHPARSSEGAAMGIGSLLALLASGADTNAPVAIAKREQASARGWKGRIERGLALSCGMTCIAFLWFDKISRNPQPPLGGASSTVTAVYHPRCLSCNALRAQGLFSKLDIACVKI
jgi:hypothetical protein